MATVDFTLTFASDAQGLVDDVPGSFAFHFQSGDGNPIACIEFTATTTGGGFRAKSASFFTWEDLGVPPGCPVTYVAVVDLDLKTAVYAYAGSPAVEFTTYGIDIRSSVFNGQVVGSTLHSGSQVKAVGGWHTEAGSGDKAITSPTSWGQSNSQIKFEVGQTISNPGAGSTTTFRFDNIHFRITYTAPALLAAISAGASTPTSMLRVERNLAAVAAGTTTPTGRLTIPHDLTGASVGSSVVVASNLRVERRLATAVAGTAVPYGRLAILRNTAAAIAGSSAIAGMLRVERRLATTPAGTTVPYGRLVISRDLAAAIAGRSVVAAGMVVRWLTSSTGASAPAGALSVTRQLRAAAAGQSTLASALFVTRGLAAAVVGNSTLAGAFSATRFLRASPAGQASVGGALRVAPGLFGSSHGTAGVLASLSSTRLLAAVAAGTSTVTVILTGYVYPGASGKSIYLKDRILDHILGGVDYARPPVLTLHLYTVFPSTFGYGTEVAVTDWSNYIAATITNNGTNFPPASAGTKSNGAVIDFGTPVLANPVTLAGWALKDGSGNYFYWGEFYPPIPVTAGDPINFGVGNLILKEVDQAIVGFAGKSDYLKDKILNHILGGGDYLRPSTLTMHFYTSAPNSAGGGTEVSTADWSNYSQVLVPNDPDNFPPASGAMKTNGAEIDFGTPTLVSPVTLAGWALKDLSANHLFWGVFPAPVPVVDGDPTKFGIGSLILVET